MHHPGQNRLFIDIIQIVIGLILLAFLSWCMGYYG